MSDTLKKTARGRDIVEGEGTLSAELHNLNVDAIKANLRGKNTFGQPVYDIPLEPDLWIANASGADIPQFGIVGIGAPCNPPDGTTLDAEESFKNDNLFLSASPTNGQPFAILLEPIPKAVTDDFLGKAKMIGEVKCKVSIATASDQWAAPITSDYAKLLSQSATGPAFIVYRNAPAAWDNTVAYNIGDMVSKSGVYYTCTTAHTGHTPPNVTYWSVGAVRWCYVLLLGVAPGGSFPDASPSVAHGLITNSDQELAGAKIVVNTDDSGIGFGAWGDASGDIWQAGLGSEDGLSPFGGLFLARSGSPGGFITNLSYIPDDPTGVSDASHLVLHTFGLGINAGGYGVRNTANVFQQATTASFVIPAVGSNVTVQTATTSPSGIPLAGKLTIDDGVSFIYAHVVSITDSTHFVVKCDAVQRGAVGDTMANTAVFTDYVEFMGATASVGGLVFHGGLYISGSPSGGTVGGGATVSIAVATLSGTTLTQRKVTGNIASITRTSQGVYKVTFTSAYSTANDYAVSALVDGTGGSILAVTSRNTTDCTVSIVPSTSDCGWISITVVG